jgi:SAM-dependent methyltransferase
MPSTHADWHARFLEQARWTAELRGQLFARAGIRDARRILEVGCGTGAILAATDFPECAQVVGLDCDRERLRFARTKTAGAHFTAGNALVLPFPSQSFDIVYCHFLLLWLEDPGAAFAEMRRAVRPGGAVLSLAEPDFDARIDYPAELAAAGRAQRDGLARQGADPAIGRRVGALMAASGLRVAETGILGARWTFSGEKRTRAAEWDLLREDSGESLADSDWDTLNRTEHSAWESGARVQFVPTFYCLAFREE